MTTDGLEARMLSGEPFTWSSLGGTNEVDRAIQKLRKKGLITFTRNGRNCVWVATGTVAVDPRDERIAKLEATIRSMHAAVPGGSTCDPQRVADSLREIAERVGVKMTD